MKIRGHEIVTRYHVSFMPHETVLLRQHPTWRHVISTKCAENNGAPPWGEATLTKTQINAICDVLGINGREFMSDAGVLL